jgi:hypothetical protein
VTEAFAPSPRPSHRLIPSQFPPLELFDTATAADLAAVMDMVGWTNDRLVADRIARLLQSEWGYRNDHQQAFVADVARREFGQRDWLKNSRRPSTIISSQQQLVDFMLKHQLGERYNAFRT